mgnify:CR=1 FL=1
MISNTFPTLLGYLFFLVLMILSYHLPWKKTNWFAVTSFTLLLGFRGNGIDYFGYSAQFAELIKLNYGLFDERFYNAIIGYSKQNFEFLYLVIIKICKVFKWTNIPFFIFIAFCQIFFLDLFVQKFKSCKMKSFLIFYFFTTLMFVETFNVMRQLIAILIYINVVPYIIERDYKRYFIFTGLLSLVHSSSLILLPLYFFIHYDFLKNKKIQIGIYLVSVLFPTFFISKILYLFDSVFSLISSVDVRMISYFNTDSEVVKSDNLEAKSVFVIAFRLLAFFFLWCNYEPIKVKWKEYGVIVYNLTFIGFVLQEFIFGISLQRLNYYFYYNSFIVLAMASCWVFSKENRNRVMKVYGIVIILLYIFWFFNSVSQGAAGCAPYILSKYL